MIIFPTFEALKLTIFRLIQLIYPWPN